MAFFFFTPNYVHIAAKNLEVSYGLLSARTFVGIPKLLTSCSKKIVATFVTIVFVFGIALVNFEKRSVITTMY